MDEAELLLKQGMSKLESARVLFEKAFYADSVSRAYYSMHFVARALLSTKNIHPRSHGGVVSQFGLEFVKEGVVDNYQYFVM